MGASKAERFTAEQNFIASLAKALGHPARVAIFEHLLSVEGCICDDIVSELPLSQPTVSQHLRTLKEAGLIKGSIKRNAICYCIEKGAIKELQKYLSKATTKPKRSRQG